MKYPNLLSVSADAKTSKGEKKGFLTGILYLAPHTISGYQTCPKASDGCKAACLYTAGRGIYNSVQTARIKKTKMFFEDREFFMNALVANIESLIKKAKRQKLIPTIRLNGTSDIAWEKIKVTRNGKEYGSIFEAFTELQGYDYTKILGRSKAIALPNYHLTFSLAENNDADAVKALEQGYNVAVVMNLKKSDAKPTTWGGYPVIDGDESDVRFLDEKGVIVGLTAKGQARKDSIGFVRSVNSGFKVSKSIELKLAA